MDPSAYSLVLRVSMAVSCFGQPTIWCPATCAKVEVWGCTADLNQMGRCYKYPFFKPPPQSLGAFYWTPTATSSQCWEWDAPHAPAGQSPQCPAQLPRRARCLFPSVPTRQLLMASLTRPGSWSSQTGRPFSGGLMSLPTLFPHGSGSACTFGLSTFRVCRWFSITG